MCVVIYLQTSVCLCVHMSIICIATVTIAFPAILATYFHAADV